MIIPKKLFWLLLKRMEPVFLDQEFMILFSERGIDQYGSNPSHTVCSKFQIPPSELKEIPSEPHELQLDYNTLAKHTGLLKGDLTIIPEHPMIIKTETAKFQVPETRSPLQGMDKFPKLSKHLTHSCKIDASGFKSQVELAGSVFPQKKKTSKKSVKQQKYGTFCRIDITLTDEKMYFQSQHTQSTYEGNMELSEKKGEGDIKIGVNINLLEPVIQTLTKDILFEAFVQDGDRRGGAIVITSTDPFLSKYIVARLAEKD
ncbi:MAG: hypothetical protein PVF58_14380 [Candidatus Methanofastidiosia archaeon]|jgi:hypothetical protein